MRIKKKYPPNWPQVSMAAKERAGWKCVFCGAAHGQPHPLTGSKVVLTTAHLGVPKPDGTPGDPEDLVDLRPENLAPLCQKCHLKYDQPLHLKNAALTRRRKKIAQGQLEL